MSRRLFDHDPEAGITQWFHYDDSNDTFFIETVQDVEAHVEANKREFNQYTSGRDRWGDYQKVAHIPNVVLADLMATGALWDQAYMRKWLNSPENAVFRTRPGRV